MTKSPPQSDLALVGSFILWASEIESHTGVTVCGQAHRDAICAAARELMAIRQARSKAGATKSKKRAKASRANGKLGGRPPKNKEQ